MRFQAPRGTADVLPAESHRWAWLESEFRALTALFGYKEIRTPTFEDTALFVRTSGETSDIVSKQMYTFMDKGDRSITLKPEGTAPAIRAVVEHNLCPPGTVTRLSYITPVFRYERPQKGRLREPHQVGLELLGSSSPEADAEVVEVVVEFYRRLGISDVQVALNTLGRDECRARFREAILAHAKGFLATQTVEIQHRVQQNPLRLLDSKDPEAIAAMSDGPVVTDFLEDDSRDHFEKLQRLLSDAGVSYRLAPEIVRGLDYYTQTVFEVHSDKLGSQSALCGGGRYDRLVEELGGAPTPSVGVGLGIERALLVLDAMAASPPEPSPVAFLAQATDAARSTVLSLARTLRAANVSAVVDPEAKSLRSQLRQADKIGAQYSIVIGDEEMSRGVVQLKDLAGGSQTEVPIGEVVDRLRGQI